MCLEDVYYQDVSDQLAYEQQVMEADPDYVNWLIEMSKEVDIDEHTWYNISRKYE